MLFRPFTQAELLKVLELILAGVNKTLAAQKVSVAVDDDAKQLLVQRGYDPRLGARPMRRVVQKAVENTVAKQVLSGEIMPGGTVQVSRQQVELALGSSDSIPAPDTTPVASSAPNAPGVSTAPGLIYSEPIRDESLGLVDNSDQIPPNNTPPLN